MIITCCNVISFYTDAISRTCCRDFDQGSGPILMSIARCSGGEYRLAECTYDTDTMDRDHEEDWGVMCSIGKECMMKALHVQL